MSHKYEKHPSTEGKVQHLPLHLVQQAIPTSTTVEISVSGGVNLTNKKLVGTNLVKKRIHPTEVDNSSKKFKGDYPKDKETEANLNKEPSLQNYVTSLSYLEQLSRAVIDQDNVIHTLHQSLPLLNTTDSNECEKNSQQDGKLYKDGYISQIVNDCAVGTSHKGMVSNINPQKAIPAESSTLNNDNCTKDLNVESKSVGNTPSKKPSQSLNNGELKRQRFLKTQEALKNSGLLDVTMKTAQLINQQSILDAEIQELKVNTAKLLQSFINEKNLKPGLKTQPEDKCASKNYEFRPEDS